jgi:hypothetical protein
VLVIDLRDEHRMRGGPLQRPHAHILTALALKRVP